MKILLIGEYSRLHNSLKEGLQKNGHKVTLLGSGDGFKNYPVDIKIDSIFFNLKLFKLFAKLIDRLFKISLNQVEIYYKANKVISDIKGYDVVQLINENAFRTLPSLEILLIKRLINNNKKDNKEIDIDDIPDDVAIVLCPFSISAIPSSKAKVVGVPYLP